MGWIAPIWVGFVLSLGGLIILLIAFAVEKATQKPGMIRLSLNL